MKKRVIIFFGIIVVIFAAIAIVAAFAGARPTSMIASPDVIREWARDEYDKLFTGPLDTFPTLKSHPISSFSLDTSKPESVKIEWRDTDDDRSLYQFGTRVDGGVGGREVKLPDGQIITLVAVGTYFPGDPMVSKYQAEMTWYDPATLEPIEEPAGLGLPPKMDVDADDRKLIAVFSTSKPATPVRWHFLQAKDGRNLAPIHNSSRFQVVDNMQVYMLDLNIYHQTSVDLLLSISYGEPELKVVDLRKNDLSTPVMFAGGNAQLAVFFLQDGDQNSAGWGGSGDNKHHEFRWKPARAKSREKSFAVIGIWPSVHSNQMEWRMKDHPKGEQRWRSVYANDGFEELSFPTDLSGVNEIEIRYFPHVAHSIFRLAGIPRAPEVTNLFTHQTGPITFEYQSQPGQFISKSSQTTGLNLYNVWPQSSFPLKFDNTSPAALLKEAELLSGKQFYLNPDTLKFEDPPAPWTERFKEWLDDLL